MYGGLQTFYKSKVRLINVFVRKFVDGQDTRRFIVLGTVESQTLANRHKCRSAHTAGMWRTASTGCPIILRRTVSFTKYTVSLTFSTGSEIRRSEGPWRMAADMS